ncbi:MAG: UDP-2,3-diacylglucosamine diphosphatase LpxG [Verrucomicrobia bacterium]|nr:UDP-2,3-diacylglucosamine diphosphatase LpxG [Verrucomicrobiota bacterium]MBS0637081.1 UDP-2,3-diacylglucosamine diphosphatase LpxG [Verrucomicrobiota bacterium]
MQLSSLKNSTTFVERLWDLWCIVSVIGIWPRFIEPRLILTSRHKIPMPQLPRELEGLKVVQISDLHFPEHVPQSFLRRISKRIEELKPDCILITGDFLSYSVLKEPERLKSFLKTLKAPLGTFAIFGNHDYKEYVSLGKDGRFRKVESHLPVIMRGFARLFSLNDNSSEGAIVRSPVEEFEELKTLLDDAGIRLLHNETVQIGKNNARLNLTGLGDYMAGQCQPVKAYAGYDMRTAGIVLSHNPDSYDALAHYPGDLLLFGHTHGGQVNLPFIWKKVTPLKNKALKSGLFHIDNRSLYVNRGLAATFPFRWFAPPEIALFELVKEGPLKTPLWDRLFPKQEAAEAVLNA